MKLNVNIILVGPAEVRAAPKDDATRSAVKDWRDCCRDCVGPPVGHVQINEQWIM